MKSLHVVSAIFLGRNTGSLAARFEFHLWALIPLLLFGAIGSGFRNISKLIERRGDAQPVWLDGAAALADVSLAGAVALMGYVLVVSIVLTVLVLLVKGESTDQTS